MADRQRIVLIRHAKSDWSHPEQGDFDRPLAPRGLRATQALKPWLAARISRFDLVLCSPARRTMQTMQLLGLDGPAQIMPALYLATADIVLDTLRQAPALPALALIGHNDGIARAAARLVATPPDHPRFGDYPTGATLIVDIAANTPLSEGTGEVVDFIVPRDLE